MSWTEAPCAYPIQEYPPEIIEALQERGYLL